MKISCQVHKPIIVFFVFLGISEQLSKAGHDWSYGSLGEVGSIRSIQRVFSKIGISVQQIVVTAFFHAVRNGMEFGQFTNHQFCVPSIQTIVLTNGKAETLNIYYLLFKVI